jgi:hypothetical protein
MGCDSTDFQLAQPVDEDFHLLVVSGDGQMGTVATELPKPVVVQVVKGRRPVVGQVVNFVVTTASDPLNVAADAGAPSVTDTVFKGKVFAGTAITDSNGKAQDFWMLGARTSYPQKLEVRATDMTTGKQVFAAFTATALPGPAARMIPYRMGPVGVDAGVGYGDGGSSSVDGGTNGPLTETVTVYDVLGNPVNNVSVTFSVTAGGGSVSPTVVKTGADGSALTTWTLGQIPNTNNVLVASAPGVASVSWTSYVGCPMGNGACSYGSGICVDLQHDPNNCGWCGRQCGNGVCVNGGCQCPSSGADGGGGMTMCWSNINNNQVCVDLQNDNGNCGWCGNQCPSGTTCAQGTCQCPGSGGDGGLLISCWGADGGQSCVDPQNDSNNCGMCGNHCPEGSGCVWGSCQCPGGGDGGAGMAMCWSWVTGTSSCVDVQNDNGNCGMCGNQCPSGSTCTQGTCQCPGGGGDGGILSFCWGGDGGQSCVDLQNDPNHCGGCGNRCPSGTACVAGACSCSNGFRACQTESGYTCADLQNDKQNCGGCNWVCGMKDDPFLCREGHCVYCPTDTIYCQGSHACVDPNSDTRNCGGCGIACRPGEYCAAGRCGCGGTYCGNTCVDTNSDPDHCGGCGPENVCQGEERRCISGQCHLCSEWGANYKACSGTCVDLYWDVNNCGSCGHVCTLNQACVQGGCVSGQ